MNKFQKKVIRFIDAKVSLSKMTNEEKDTFSVCKYKETLRVYKNNVEPVKFIILHHWDL